MSKFPEKLFYTDTHEWVRLDNDGNAVIGVTDHAQEAMGDMVYIDLPTIGDHVAVKGECGVLESVKSASDFYSPIAGEIIEVNEKLADTPDLVNKDPYGDGWIAKIKPKNTDVLNGLMNAAAYQKSLDLD